MLIDALDGAPAASVDVLEGEVVSIHSNPAAAAA